MRWLGERRPVLGSDTETGGLTWWNNALRLVQFGDLDTGWVVPWQLWGGVAKEALERYEGEVVFHNAAFDLRFLEENGVDVRDLRSRTHDTSVQAVLLDSTRIGTRRKLKTLAEEHVDRNATRGEELLSSGMAKNGWTWGTVPVNFPPYWAYSALDPVLAAHLHVKQMPKIRAQHHEVYEVEMALLHILSAMERRGLLVDEEYARGKAEAMGQFEEAMLAYIGERWPAFRRKRGRKGAEEEYISLGSDCLAKVLLEEGAPLTKTTKTGKFSVDEEVLSGLASAGFELATCITQVKQAHKFKTSYFDAILANLHGGRVRPSLNPIGARTGRMSVSRPPFQQLPSDSPLVRDAIVAGEGNALLTVDYDQIQLRMLAHYAQEETMLEAIRTGEDLHWANARMLYGPDATPKHRKLAKGGAFGKVFGAGPATLASQQGIPLADAQAFMGRFDAKFQGVAGFQRDVERIVRERQSGGRRGYIDTFIGRRLYVDKGKEYTGVCFTCQGGEADVVKLRIIELDKAGLADFALLPVHDEILFEVPERDAKEMLPEIERVMTDADTFSVPMSASGQIIARWGDPYREKE